MLDWFYLVLPSLKGDSPARGNVVKGDKRVPVYGRKGGTALVVEGFYQPPMLWKVSISC